MKEAIKAYLQYLEIERNASVHTITAYQNDLNQFELFIAGFIKHSDPEPEKVTRPMLRLWMGQLSDDGLSKSSIARKAAALRSFFRYCYRRGYVQSNPAQHLIIPRREKKLPQTVSEHDIDKIIDLIDHTTDEGIRDRAIFELFYGTGIRLRELVSIDLPDMDLKRRQLRVMGKGSKERIVPFGKQAQNALTEYLKIRYLFQDTRSPDTALFLTKKGKRLYPRAVQRIVQKYLALASEVSQKSPHVLRHSFATHLLDRGVDIRVIKELLGHANLAATQVYTHTSLDHLRKVYKKAHPRAETTNPPSEPENMRDPSVGKQLKRSDI
jgi:tyrosine recombinase XerC